MARASGVPGSRLGARCARADAADTVSSLPRPVCLLAVSSLSGPHLVTVTSVSVAAVDPVLVTVALGSQSRMNGLIAATGAFALGVLAAEQRDLAERFARPGRAPDLAQLDGLRWHSTPYSNSPLPHALVAWLDWELVARNAAPGVSVIVGQARAVSGAGRGTGRPLLRLRGEYLPASAPVRSSNHPQRRDSTTPGLHVVTGGAGDPRQPLEGGEKP